MQSTPRLVKVPRDSNQIAYVKNNCAEASPLETIVVSLATGLGGYALGKAHGCNKGYNQAKTEDAQLIEQYEAQSQAARHDVAYLRAENSRLQQEKGSLHKENEILKGLLRQQPTTPQAEAILKALGRVEFRLTELLPPEFDPGDNGQNPKLN